MEGLPLEVQFQYARAMADVPKMSPEAKDDFIATLLKGYLYAEWTCREQARELAKHLGEGLTR